MSTHANKRSRDGLLRISDLARETGVSLATIKFYLREGLLPAPTLKTGRNMAYYDRSFVERIRFIKELQQKRFLPLDVIRRILDQSDRTISPTELDTLLGLEGTVYEAIHYAPGRTRLTREEAKSRYQIADAELDLSIRLGVLTPTTRSGVQYFEGDDVLMLENFRAMKEAGLTKELIPVESSVPFYVEVVDRLVHEELKIFTQGVTGTVAPERLPEMALAAVKLAEQFVVLLRRKRLLAAIQQYRAEREHGAQQATGS